MGSGEAKAAREMPVELLVSAPNGFDERMVAPAGWLAISVTVGVVVLLAVLYITIFLRGRRIGTRGVVQRSHLSCPRCGREFDYDWFPGASFSTVRFGKPRYMACPLCQSWSVFSIYDRMVARTSGRSDGRVTGPAQPPVR